RQCRSIDNVLHSVTKQPGRIKQSFKRPCANRSLWSFWPFLRPSDNWLLIRLTNFANVSLPCLRHRFNLAQGRVQNRWAILRLLQLRCWLWFRWLSRNPKPSWESWGLSQRSFCLRLCLWCFCPCLGLFCLCWLRLYFWLYFGLFKKGLSLF